MNVLPLRYKTARPTDDPLGITAEDARLTGATRSLLTRLRALNIPAVWTREAATVPAEPTTALSTTEYEEPKRAA